MDINHFKILEKLDAEDILDFLVTTFERWRLDDEVLFHMNEALVKIKDVKHHKILDALQWTDKNDSEIDIWETEKVPSNNYQEVKNKDLVIDRSV